METIKRTLVLFSSDVKGMGISNFINEGQNRLLDMMSEKPTDTEMETMLDHYDGSVEETDQEDILRPMPNWFEMSDQDVMKTVCYHRRESKNGASRLVPMKDKDGNLIPIKRDQDGMTIGSNRWSNESPEDTIMATAAKVGKILEDWGYNMAWLDQEINKLKQGQCLEEMSPFKSGEDLVEAIKLRKIEDIRNSEIKVHKILTSWFGVVMANKVLKESKFILEKAALYCMEEMDFEEKQERISAQTRTGHWITQTNNWGTRRKWVEDLSTTMGTILKAGRNRYGHDFRIEKSAWVIISRWISKTMWGIITGSIHGHMNEAVETMIKVYCQKMLQAEVMVVLQEDNHVDRTMGLLDKTPIQDHFKPEQADWEWWQRE